MKYKAKTQAGAASQRRVGFGHSEADLKYDMQSDVTLPEEEWEEPIDLQLDLWDDDLLED